MACSTCRGLRRELASHVINGRLAAARHTISKALKHATADAKQSTPPPPPVCAPQRSLGSAKTRTKR